MHPGQFLCSLIQHRLIRFGGLFVLIVCGHLLHPCEAVYHVSPLTVTVALMLRSLNAITKESAILAVIFGRPTPDPRFGPSVELLRRDASGLLDLFGVGKALPGKRIAAKEAPPALLQMEPARSGRNEDVMQAWMPFQPGAGLQTVVTREIVADHKNVPAGVVRFDVREQCNVAFRVA